MINNVNKNFFSKNNRIRLCTIALTGVMVASPFIVRGMVDYAINDLNQRNEIAVAQEQEKEGSRITIEYEGEFNVDNGAIIIVNKDEINKDGKTEIIAAITPNADDPHVDLPAGTYIISNYNDSYEIELDGETDYDFTVNYQTGEITNNNEKEIREPRTK